MSDPLIKRPFHEVPAQFVMNLAKEPRIPSNGRLGLCGWRNSLGESGGGPLYSTKCIVRDDLKEAALPR